MSIETLVPARSTTTRQRSTLESAVIRFAGDSGDGIQVTGSRFAAATALAGNDLATFPDFPAEIRAPVGTTYGVSAFQINFGAREIKTSGDAPDVLVAFNPAALKVELNKLKKGATVIVDKGTFNDRNFRKSGYQSDPLTDGTVASYRVIDIDISRMTLDAVKPLGVSQHDGLRCKNMWALGLIYWMYDRDRTPAINWLKKRFAKDELIANANIAALNAGHAFGETTELRGDLAAYVVPPAPMAEGLYRTVTGGEALALGLAVGAYLARIPLTFVSYPITPASPLLHTLSTMRDLGVTTLQAEDEIAAACAAIGASFAGSLGVTSSSGPGIALKGEAIGLAVSTELPLVVVNTQRAGPSTGMPTKTEQADLNLALYGRHGESPVAVLAARSPVDCFETAIEAVRIATRSMTPVILLSDGYIANAAQPWHLPDIDQMAPFPVHFRTDPKDFQAFERDPQTLARPWAVPGTPGLMHRIGGIEKSAETGHISYEPSNHQRMTDLRAEKIERIADDIPPQAVDAGAAGAKVAVVGWGSTYGPISRAVDVVRNQGHDVAHVHFRHLSPLPRNLGDLLRSFGTILAVEMNTGQLRMLLRATYLIDVKGVNKVSGQPFKIEEVEAAILAALEN